MHTGVAVPPRLPAARARRGSDANAANKSSQTNKGNRPNEGRGITAPYNLLRPLNRILVSIRKGILGQNALSWILNGRTTVPFPPREEPSTVRTHLTSANAQNSIIIGWCPRKPHVRAYDLAMIWPLKAYGQFRL
jgi:hypothetical protein